MCNYKEYRIGSPVCVGGKATVIEQLPKDDKDPFGYKVSGLADGVPLADINPIVATPDVLSYFGFTREKGSWVYEANKHVVILGDDLGCSIDGCFKDNITFLHELKNILSDNCDGYVLKRYYGTCVE